MAAGGRVVSFASLLTHTVTVVRTPRDMTDLDDWGQPTADAEVRTTLAAMVQPRNGREVDDSRSAGAPIGDHVVFLEPTADIATEDAIEYEGYRYEVTAIRPFHFGSAPHLEVDARRIGAIATVVAAEVPGS